MQKTKGEQGEKKKTVARLPTLNRSAVEVPRGRNPRNAIGGKGKRKKSLGGTDEGLFGALPA